LHFSISTNINIYVCATINDITLLIPLPYPQASQIAEVAEATMAASSTKGNPVALSLQELKDILSAAL
jgi:alcohol dehydrogenase class IV